MRKLYLFQVAYATDEKKKNIILTIWADRTNHGTRLVKMKKKKVSIDAQEENRNQNYLWRLKK